MPSPKTAPLHKHQNNYEITGHVGGTTNGQWQNILTAYELTHINYDTGHSRVDTHDSSDNSANVTE